MFETAISLEAMVRERTAQLEDALAKLAEANADLASAHGRADAARKRLRDAIDSINEGFVLFDAEDRLEARSRSEEHKSELQSLMRIPTAAFCLKHNKIRSINS